MSGSKQKTKITQELDHEKRVAIYARVSSKKQKDGETIESQVNALRSWADEKGFHLPKEYVFLDNGFSGSSLQRPALEELRDLVKSEPLHAVLVYAPDRLARDYPHQLVLMEEFRRQGVQVLFLKSPYKNGTPEDKLLSHFQGIFAEYERTLIMERSRRGRIFKAKQEDPSIMPRMAYGYGRERINGKNSVCIVENESSVVKDIFRLYIHEGLTLAEVARWLTENHIKSPNQAAKWHASTVRGILKNRAYTGTAHYGKTERCEGISGKVRRARLQIYHKPMHARRNRPENEWIPITYPPLVSEVDFEMAQEQLKKNSQHAHRNTREPGLLQGLMVCVECGLPFYKRFRIRNNGERTNTYYCRSQMNKGLKSCANQPVDGKKLDDLVFGEVIKLLKEPAVIQKELDRRAKEVNDTSDRVRREIQLQKECAKLTGERDRLLDAYQSGVLTLSELVKRHKEMGSRQLTLEKETEALRALKLQDMAGRVFVPCLEKVTKGMKESIDNLPFDDKRKLVRLLVDSVKIGLDTVTIDHCISPKMLIEESGGQLKTDGHG